jgi:N-methylhydantoinase A
MGQKHYRIAVDTGGTFVDAVEFDELTGKFRIAKSPTTPSNPVVGFLNAIEKLRTPLDEVSIILHGTTLGVNAIIQKKGAQTCIITNRGFKDVYEIGRGDVPSYAMYDYNYIKPRPLVRRRNIIEVDCRIDRDGRVVRDIDENEVRKSVSEILSDGIQSVAITFLHSYRNYLHEQRVKEILKSVRPGIFVSASSDIVREYREYERLSTTVLDAYIKPIVSDYLDRLGESLEKRGFRGVLLIMKSDGGTMPVSTAATTPVFTLQSGPAGGVTGAIHLARQLSIDKIITMDIGGTSLDVCVVEDFKANVIHKSSIDNYPLLMTMFDIRSIGAGGGSLALLRSGLLQVGPESAGADPGPMCYGKGGLHPTVTDASVILGYIEPNTFLSGDMKINPELSLKGLKEQISSKLGIDVVEAAAGIIDIMVTNSLGAIKQITVEEGKDPSEYTLVSYGGAGPLFASILAEELGIPTVLVPPVPAAFSAWGMLAAGVTYEISQTNLQVLEETELEEIREFFEPLVKEVISKLESQALPLKSEQVEKTLELRYLGQEHTLEIEISNTNSTKQIREEFDKLHDRRYGHKMDNQVEIVNYRAKVIGILEKPKLNVIDDSGKNLPQKVGTRHAFCLTTHQMKEFSVYKRDNLLFGHRVSGPAIIDEGVTSTLVHTGQEALIDRYGNIILRVGKN